METIVFLSPIPNPFSVEKNSRKVSLHLYWQCVSQINRFFCCINCRFVLLLAFHVSQHRSLCGSVTVGVRSHCRIRVYTLSGQHLWITCTSHSDSAAARRRFITANTAGAGLSRRGCEGDIFTVSGVSESCALLADRRLLHQPTPNPSPHPELPPRHG